MDFIGVIDSGSDMMAISRSEVPEYLRNTKLFLSFSDDADDDTILIPRDCFKLDTVITSTSELHNLCKTIRYWLFDGFPPGMIYYLVEQFDTEVEKTMRIFDNEFHVANMLAEINRNKSAMALQIAAKYGRMDFIRYFETVGAPITSVALQSAANYGQLECLTHLHQRQLQAGDEQPCKSILCLEMMRMGHINCLKFCIEHGCPVSYSMLDCAQWRNNIDIFQYLLNMSDLRDERICIKAAELGNVECLTIAVDCRCEVTTKTLLVAMQENNMSCVRYLLWSNIFTTAEEQSKATLCAVTRNRPGCLRELCEAGWPLHPTAVHVAVQTGRIECFKVLQLVGEECITSRIMRDAILAGQLPVVTYLHEQGCPWDEKEVILCAQLDKSACLHYLIQQRGIPSSPMWENLQLRGECAKVVFEERVNQAAEARCQELRASIPSLVEQEVAKRMAANSAK